MKKIMLVLVSLAVLQACAVYPPYGRAVVYNGYGYEPNRYYGGHHGWNGGGHHGWHHGHGHHGWNGGRGQGWGGGNNWGGQNGWGYGHH